MKKLLLSFAVMCGVAANAQTASVQIIHNSPVPAAKTVDVYIGASAAMAVKVKDNLRFREATTFLSVTSNTASLKVYLTDSSAANATTNFFNQAIPTLNTDSNYLAIVSGVTGTGYESNPDGVDSSLKVTFVSNVKRTAPAGAVNISIFNGSTDMPAIRVYPRNTTTILFDNLKYGDNQKYFTAPVSWYQLAIAPAGSFSEIFTWYADVTALSGQSYHIFASGFYTPANDNNGAAFGLFAALDNGTVVALPKRTTATGQLLHNASDPLADTVDIWVNGTKLYPNFAYRTASPFIPLSAEFPLSIYVCSNPSTSIADSLTPRLTLFLNTGESYILMATGNAGTGFAANPDGVNTDVAIKVINPARAVTGTPGNFDVAVAHASTDAPTIDVTARSGETLVNDAAYFDVSTYSSLAANANMIDVKDETGANIIASYDLPLDVLAGSASAGLIFASGYLNPAANNNGPAFGMYILLPTGAVLPLSVKTSVQEVSAESFGLKLYPNPARNTMNLIFDAKQDGNAKIEFVDMQGRLVKTVANDFIEKGVQNYDVNVTDMNSGIYFAKITTASEQTNVRFVIE